MSIALLSDNHYRTIVKNIVDSVKKDEDCYRIQDVIRTIEDEEISRDDSILSATKHIQNLHTLNLDAYNSKYGCDEKNTLRLLGYKKCKTIDSVDLFAALSSIGYQIEEDYLEDTKLEEHEVYNSLFFLKLLTGTVAENFLQQSKEYQTTNAWMM